jgi:hypothetical protein
VTEIMTRAIRGLDLRYPEPTSEQEAALVTVRRALEEE